MKNNYIAIAEKGKEFFYKKDTVIKCNSSKQAIALCDHLNKNNDTSCKQFRCNNYEEWHVFDDLEPSYKVKTTKGKISLISLV